MATALLATIFALALGHLAPNLARFRNFDWLKSWAQFLKRQINPADNVAKSAIAAAAIVVVPALLLGSLQLLVEHALFGLPAFVLSILVIFYCWGPRDLDLEVDAIVSAPEYEQQKAAIAQLTADGPAAGRDGSGKALVDAVFHAALTRWFGILFWFVLLGPVGALLYRLVQLLVERPEFQVDLDARQVGWFAQCLAVLNWPVAHLMAVALALIADFDAVATAWRNFYIAGGRFFSLDIGFLFAAARSSVESDIDENDHFADMAKGPILEMQDALALIWRILLAWGVVFALFVLAGKIS